MVIILKKITANPSKIVIKQDILSNQPAADEILDSLLV